MSACTSCASPDACPDPLLSLGKLCREMPGMAPCAAWGSWCRAPGSEHDLPAFCKGAPHNPNGPGDVPMRMYFHTGWTDYILLESWVPQSAGSYAASLLAVCLAAVVSAWLRAAQRLRVPRVRQEGEAAYAAHGEPRPRGPRHAQLRARLPAHARRDDLQRWAVCCGHPRLWPRHGRLWPLGTLAAKGAGRQCGRLPQPPPTSPTANEVVGVTDVRCAVLRSRCRKRQVIGHDTRDVICDDARAPTHGPRCSRRRECASPSDPRHHHARTYHAQPDRAHE